jgi:hypothetical protein
MHKPDAPVTAFPLKPLAKSTVHLDSLVTHVQKSVRRIVKRSEKGNSSRIRRISKRPYSTIQSTLLPSSIKMPPLKLPEHETLF